MAETLTLSQIVQMKDPKKIKKKKQTNWTFEEHTDLVSSIIKRRNSPSLSQDHELEEDKDISAIYETSELSNASLSPRNINPSAVQGLAHKIARAKSREVPNRSNLSSHNISKLDLEGSHSAEPSNRKTQIVKEMWIKSMGFGFAQKYNRNLNLRPGIFLSDQQIREGIDICYGKGERKKLRPGEEALVKKNMKELIDEAKTSPELLTGSNLVTVNKLLKRCKLTYLLKYPGCIKQIEGLWKNFLTKIPPNYFSSLPKIDKSVDPILAEMEEGEDLAKKPLVPLSERYRKHMKFIK